MRPGRHASLAGKRMRANPLSDQGNPAPASAAFRLEAALRNNFAMVIFSGDLARFSEGRRYTMISSPALMGSGFTNMGTEI